MYEEKEEEKTKEEEDKVEEEERRPGVQRVVIYLPPAVMWPRSRHSASPCSSFLFVAS